MCAFGPGGKRQIGGRTEKEQRREELENARIRQSSPRCVASSRPKEAMQRKGLRNIRVFSCPNPFCNLFHVNSRSENFDHTRVFREKGRQGKRDKEKK